MKNTRTYLPLIIFMITLGLAAQDKVPISSTCFDDAPCSSGVFQLYYYDSDGDGVGSGSGVCYCTSNVPSNYSSRNDDCDDRNRNITGPRSWYVDSDGDGLGGDTRVRACYPASNYVTNSSDCDDRNPNIGGETTWYRDSDGDGHGDPNTSTTSCTRPIGYVPNHNDCDDTAYSSTPQLTFYRDADRDGFGNPNNTILDCTAPSGYTTDNTDCDDSDGNINPETIWYPDNDGDGYPYVPVSLGNGIVQCEQPIGYILFKGGGRDCDDSDASINPETVWYEDADGDGFGDPDSTITQCTQPAGYVLTQDLVDPLPESPLPDLTGLDTQDMNMTYSVEPYQPVKTLTQLDALASHQKVQSKTYYDGLGRPVQEVAMYAGGISYEGYLGNDIVNYIEYDRFGRNVKKYAPYGKIDQETTPGEFQVEARDELMDFYAEGNMQNSFVQTSNPFSETVFDRSPRNRAVRQASPGDNWKISSDHEVSTLYAINAPNEVRYFEVSLDENLQPTLVVNGHYAQGELAKTVVRDENWAGGVDQTAEEFTNKQGQTVLKRTYVDGLALSTYYVYDIYDNLTYIIPPKAEPDAATIDHDVLDGLCFQFRYDTLRRQVEKRNPGVDGWERIVYDHENRPIMAQDANMALNGQWLFTKYDKFGRATYTGLYTSTQTREALQRIADEWVDTNGLPHNEQRMASTTTIGDTDIIYSNRSFPKTNLKVLSVNFYDNYTIADPDMPTPPTTVLGRSVTTNTKGLATALWIRVLDGGTSWNKSYTFYDERARPIRVYSRNYQGGYTIVDSELDFRGKVTKTISKHRKDTAAPLVSIEDRYTYDHMERVRMQEQTVYDGDTNSSNFTDRIISGFVYDALGQLSTKYIEPASDRFGWQASMDTSSNEIESIAVDRTSITITKDFFLQQGSHTIGHNFSLDASGLNYDVVLTIREQSIHGAIVYQKRLSVAQVQEGMDFMAATEGNYSVSVRLAPPGDTFMPVATFSANNITLSPGSSPTAPYSVSLVTVSALQTINYKYNARGSMTDINDVDTLGDDLFAYRMNYDRPTVAGGATPMYNGNIAETQWRSKNDNTLRGYAYRYDAISRLTAANNVERDYRLNAVTYDKNGNILSLNRNRHGGQTDDFTYEYDNGNKLLGISGSKTATYTYDANGNMLSDSSKGIGSITYNHLDLPDTVTFTNGDVIAYLYDAVGNKLRKTVTQGGQTSTTEYWDGFQYLQGQLQFFAQPEGYIAVNRPVGTSQQTFAYVYSYTDHLGNVRLSYSDMDGNGNITVTEIVKERNYYPFGLLHQGYNNVVHAYGSIYNYGFGGKELQLENGIGWLDFGSRNYDAELGRWMNIDPQAGRYVGLSPFAAMGNNPITFVDPNGEELLTGIIIGAVAGAIIGGASVAIANPRADFGDILGGALIGAFSGAVTAGIGQYYQGGQALLLGSKTAFLEQAAAHAIFQGGLAAAQGGNFWQGAATAAASSLVGGATPGGGPVAQSAMGAFTGGFTSLLTGGSFEQGFATGLTVVALNHALHAGAKGWLPDNNKGCCGYEEYFGAKANEVQGQIDRLNSGNSLRNDTKTFLGVAGRGLSAGAMGLSYHGKSIAKIGELTIGSIGRWNAYSKSSLAISGKVSSYVRLFARKAGALSLGFNVIDYSNGSTSGYDLGVNSGFTLYGMYGGPIGWFLSGSYFIFDITGGKAIMERRAQHMHNDIKKGMGPREMMKKWSCFVKGTKVLMADLSEKNIETIELGDIILSVNINTMKLEEDIVIEIPEIEKKYKIIRVEFSNGTINEFSPAHPYWVLGKGWSVYDLEEAKTELTFGVAQLEVGDTVLFYEKGKLKQTTIMSLVDTKEFVEMYNVEHVKKNNTFFANKILVHNKRIN